MNSLNPSVSKVVRCALKTLTACATLCALFIVATSQTPASNRAEQMKMLDFLVGEWKGEGWQLKPDGTRWNRFLQSTKVQVKDGNSMLRIKDSRTYKPSISSGDNTIFVPGAPVFHSSTLDASIFYDEQLKLYRWRGENPYGRRNPLEASLLRERVLQYGMPFSMALEPSDGNRRTTIEVTESGEWHEMLEVWKTDRWYKVEQSVLKKVK